jgi:hypothetical protein
LVGTAAVGASRRIRHGWQAHGTTRRAASGKRRRYSQRLWTLP